MTDDKQMGRNLWFLVIAASVSSLGGFLFGYDNIVISGAIGYLEGTVDGCHPGDLGMMRQASVFTESLAAILPSTAP
ncbi:MAG: hypothetical protein WCK89_02025 [bacterium]